MFDLKANTASQELVFGPFVDKDDGVTPETTISAPTAARIWKNGVTSTVNLSTGRTPSWTHDGDGFYTVGSLSSDVDTKGRLRIEITDSATHLPVWEDWMIKDENSYEAIITGTGYGTDDRHLISTDAQDLSTTLDVNTKTFESTLDLTATMKTSVNTEADTALTDYDPPTRTEATSDKDEILAALPNLVSGTADSGSTTTMVDAARTEADTDYWVDSWIKFTSGNIAGQVRLITGFTPGTDTITFAPATTQAVGTNTYEILPAADISAVFGHTPQTGDSFIRLGAPAGASVSADIAVIDTNVDDIETAVITNAAGVDISADVAAVKSDTADILTDTAEIGVAGAGLTDLGGMSTGMQAEVNAEVDTALTDIGLDHLLAASVTGTDIVDNSIVAQLVSKSGTADWDSYDNTTDSLEAIRDQGDSAWVTGSDTTLATGTADSGSTTTMVDAARTEADTDYWKGAIIVFTSGNISGQARLITGFTPGTDTVTFEPATTQAVGTNTYEIHKHASVELLTATQASIDAIEADTNELQTDDVPGLIAALNDLSAAEVNTEVDTALSDIGLDHLVSVAATGTDVTDNSIIAQLVSSSATADWDTYVNTTDSLQSIRDKQTDIETDTAEIGAAGAGLSNIPWNASWDTEVQSEVDDALVARSLHYLVDTALPTNWTTDVTANSALDYMADDGTATFDRTTDSLQAIADGSAPTAADIADAVWDEAKAGHVVAGSFGEEVQAHALSSEITALNDLSAAQVNTEVDTALADIGLDHLVSASVIGTDITDDSIIAQLVSASATADWDDFDNTTDALQAIRDRGDAAWTTGAGGSDRLLMVDTTIATLSTQTSFTLTAGSADDDAYNGCTIIIEDASTSTQKAVGIIDDYVGSTKTVTLLEDPGVFTMAVTDKVYVLAEKGLKPTTAADYHVDVSSGGNVGIDWANIANPSTVVDLSGTDINLVDTCTTNTDMRGTDNAALASVLGALADAAASGDPTVSDTVVSYLKQVINTLEGTTGLPVFPAESAPANNVSMVEVLRAIHADVTGLNGDVMRGTDNALLASSAPTNFGDLSITATTGRIDVGAWLGTTVTGDGDWTEMQTDLDAVLLDTADMQPKIGTVTDLGGGATLADNLSDMAGVTFATGTDSLEAIRDRGDAAWTTGAGGSDRLLMVDTTIATLSTQTNFTLTAGSSDDGAYVGCTIVIEDAATSTQKAVGIVDTYTGSTKTVNLLEDPGIFTMAVTDKVYILAEKSVKPTTSSDYHLDITNTGNAGIDWGNISNPATTVDLSATDINLADNVTLVATTTDVTNQVTADVTAISGDSTAADNLELDYDGTGYTKTNSTVGTVTNVTNQVTADVTAISGDSAAADNLELQYDGTGITGDTFPSTQQQIGSLSVGAGGISTTADTVTITVGTETGGTVTSTEELDAVLHTIEDVGNAIDFYYEFDVGVNGVATKITWNGYVANNGKVIDVYGYDWVSTSWKQVGTINGKNNTTVDEHVFVFTSAMTGTAVNAGIVRVRFDSADVVSVNTDRVLVEYTSVLEGSLTLHSGTAQAGTANTITLDTGASSIDDFYNHARVIITQGTGSEQERVITDYTGSTRVATISPSWITNPDTTSVFDVVPAQVHAETMTAGYDGGAVYIDTISGTSGTLLYVNGTASNPVDNIADAKTIADALSLRIFHLEPGSSVTLATTYNNYEFSGVGYTLDFGSQDVAGSRFFGGSLQGTATGTGRIVCRECRFATATTFGLATSLIDCNLSTDFVLDAAGTYIFDSCFSGIAGTISPSIDFQAAAETKDFSLRHYSGGMEFKNFGNLGTHTASIEGDGHIIINANCAGGTMVIRGNYRITDNAAGAVGIISTIPTATQVNQGVAQAGTATTITLDATASSTDGQYDPGVITILTGSGAGQSRAIIDYDGTTKVAVINKDWRTNPDSTSSYIITASQGDLHVNEGQAQAGGASTITLNTSGSSTDDIYIGQTIFLVAGTGQDQSRIVTDYNGTTKVATVHRAWDTQPDVTTSYVMLPLPAAGDSLVDIDSKIGTVTDLGSGATIGDNLSDMAGSTFVTATDSLEAIRDRGDSAWITGAGGTNPIVLVDTTIATLASQTSFTLTSGSSDDEAYKDCMIIIEDAATSTQKAVGFIITYTGATKTVTLGADPGVFTMGVTDKVTIVASSVVGLLSADFANVVTRINTAQADLDTITGSDGVIVATGEVVDSNLSQILGTVLTETTAGNLANNFDTFYDNSDALTATILDDIDDAANIYSYFISGSNEDAFKADEAVIYSYFTTASREDAFKATGFSTHDESDVWDYVAIGEITNSFGAKVNNIDNLAHTPAQNADAVWTELIADHSGVVGSTAESLDTAAGAGDPWAIDIGVGYTGTEAGNIVNNIKAKTDQLTFTVANQVDSNCLATGGGPIGPGSVQTDFTIQSSGLPISGVECWVSTDNLGVNTVAGTTLTDDFGQVSFMLDPGTYYLWRDSAFYNFPNPYEFTVT